MPSLGKREHMLGLALLDVSETHGTVTVWLTSRTGAAVAGHTNAVVFEAAGLDWRRVDGMLADRYVFLTKRSEAVEGPIQDLDLLPCDALAFAHEVEDMQQKLSEIFGQYREQPGKQDLADPSWFTVPPPEDAGGHLEGLPNEVALAAADFIRKTWTAWLTTERERHRRPYMPPRDALVRELPDMFKTVNRVQPFKIYR
jgi:hypothetical protein